MRTSLKQATQQHFDLQKLSPKQLQLLQQKFDDNNLDREIQNDPIAVNKTSHKGLIKWMSIAAITLLSCVMLLKNNFEDKTLSIVREVVNNHVRQKPLEIVSQNFTQTSGYFTQLDFAPLPSRIIDSTNAKILGGRYCSIESQSAAQLRYQDRHGKHLTLYQVGFDREIFGTMPNIDNNQQPNIYYMDGLKVSLWTEKGLLMVSVETP